ncbi:GMC family oxidoreductase [Pleionea sp. CnH1-48]|uniref:GMC family oxidoreductase n=1 Tax=Pleionea sp. CnH1-48 TaxID=2954494 RepID=UPI0020983F09|nr:GMC family oxidoreductase [Pleionea sp. CnH1-48]MCO7224469.1 GMC family oxidoreductase [Pleionea sp. CnH1-48]
MMDLKQHVNHQDLSRGEAPKVLEADVIVVGTGAGGGMVADILSQSGLRLIMLEEGPLKTAQDFKMKEAIAYPDLYQEAMARRTKDKAISILQGRSVGGSTTVNWTSSFRTPEQTLSYWQHEFGLTRLTPDSMAPWFERAEKQLNITPWAIPPNQNNQVLMDGAKALGWKAEIIPRNVKGCANLGYCGMGCPIGAKQSMLVTTIPAAMERGAHLYSRTRCERLIQRAGRIEQVDIRAMDNNGQPTDRVYRLKANHIILAGGAIGSPAVMLRSELEDPHQRIGRRTFLHPVAATVADMKQRVDPYSGAPQSVYSDEFLWRDGVSGKVGYKLEVPPIHPVLGSSIIPFHGLEHAKIMAGLPHMHASLALMRDGFHHGSVGGQVELDDYLAPVLDYPVTDYLWEGVTHAMLTMAELQFAAGAKRVRPMHMDAPWVNSWSEAQQQIRALTQKNIRTLLFSAHVMGGCGMGDKLENSVVNEQGRFHHLDNLWVMDGSILPTSLGVNPQLTLYALISRLATGFAESVK